MRTTADKKAYFRAWYERNREHWKAKVAAYRKANPEKAKDAVRRCHERYDAAEMQEYHRQYYLENSDRIRERSREWLKANGEREDVKARKSAYGRKWREMNPAKHCAKNIKRHASKLRRTARWLSPIDQCLIQEFYEIAKARSLQTGVKHHVDHIIPLQGRNVSGLHVPNNLQIITASQNLRKHNSYFGG